MFRVLGFALGLERCEAMIGVAAAVHAHHRHRSPRQTHIRQNIDYEMLLSEIALQLDPEAMQRQAEEEEEDKERERKRAMKKKTDAVIHAGVKREKWRGRRERFSKLLKCGGKAPKDSDSEPEETDIKVEKEVENTPELEHTRSAVFIPKEPLMAPHDPVKAYVEERKPVSRVKSTISIPEEQKLPELPRVAVTTLTNMHGQTVQRIPTPYPGKGHHQHARRYPAHYTVVYPPVPVVQHTLSSGSVRSDPGYPTIHNPATGTPVESKHVVTFHTATKQNDGGSFVRVPTAYSVGDLAAAPAAVKFHPSAKTLDGGDFQRVPTAFFHAQPGQAISRVPSDGVMSVTSSLRSREI